MKDLLLTLKPRVYDMRVRVCAEKLVARLRIHAEMHGEALNATIRHLREDEAASPAADLKEMSEEEAHAYLDALVDELLSGVGKPLPNLPAEVAVRFDASLLWHAGRLSELDSGFFA